MTDPAATLRRATAEDTELVRDLEVRGAHRPWSEASIRYTLSAPTTVAFVAGAPPVGHILASRYADEAEILSIAVVPEARRLGIGHALLTACEDAWRRAQVRNAWLEVRRDNRAALALYERHGWVDAGLRRGYYEDGADAVVMRWSGP